MGDRLAEGAERALHRVCTYAAVLNPYGLTEGGNVTLSTYVSGTGHRIQYRAADTASFLLEQAADGDRLVVAVQKRRSIVRTNDFASTSSGTFTILGREELAPISVGGSRVDPRQVEMSISQSIDTIQDAAVFPWPNRLLGEEVAVVFTSSHGTPTAAEMRRLLQPQLPDYALPTRWYRVAELPSTPAGKIDYTALRPSALLGIRVS